MNVLGPGYGKISRFLSLKFRTTGVVDNSLKDKTRDPDELDDANSIYSPYGAKSVEDSLLSTDYLVVDDDLILTQQQKVNMTAEHKNDFDLIRSVFFDDLKLSNKDTIKVLSYSNGALSDNTQMLPGDIIVIRKKGRFNKYVNFYACVTEHGPNSLATFPQVTTRDLRDMIHVVRFFNINANEEVLRSIENEIGTTIKFKENSSQAEWVKAPATLGINGLLQVGDIKFMVSPTQISFVTQNGYQYFPTIRTQGNPKIPSMQEIKSINISLIFPNAESINNQFIPLFAMYKRAPFVNIRNKDISNFFAEIRNDETGFVPVALDSIQVESVRGFPNTLQCTLNVLPFQHKGVGEVFQALRTYRDVRAQQFSTADRSEDRLTAMLDQTMHNKTQSPHSRDIIHPSIFSSSNFEESIPFRAFYQSIIEDRDYVLDDLGEVVYSAGQAIPLSIFRPKRDENKLRNYQPSANTKSVSMEYKFIPDDIRQFASKAAKSRGEELERIARESKLMLDAIWGASNGKDEFINKMHQALINREDFFNQMRNYFQRSTDYIQDWLKMHDIDVNVEPAPRITSLMELVIDYGSHKFPATAWLSRKTGNKAGAINRLHNVIDAVVDNRSEYLEPDETLDILRGVTTWYEGQDPGQTIGPTHGANLARIVSNQIVQYLQNVQPIHKTIKGKQTADNDAPASIKSRYNEREKWARMFTRFFEAFDNPGIINSLSSDLEVRGFDVDTDTLTIDNQQDVIEGWTLQFSNKFVPINLIPYKYPFYQHVGSEDINLNLSICSIQNDRDLGLKEQLSLLNDRLQSSARVITYNAPELAAEMDARLHVNVENNDPGNIFNVFGMKRMIYNGSNVASEPGKPNSWRINLNLTQANFTLRDYQSISSIPNTTGIEDDIMNLLIRSEKNDDGTLTVYRYKFNYNNILKLIDGPGPVPVGIQEDVRKTFGLEDTYNLIKRRIEEGFLNVDTIGSPEDTTIYGDGATLTPNELRMANKILISLAFYSNFIQTLFDRYRKSEDLSTAEVDNTSRANALGQLSLLFSESIRPDEWFIMKEVSTKETFQLNQALETTELQNVYRNITGRIQELHISQSEVLASVIEKEKTFSDILFRKLFTGSAFMQIFSKNTEGLPSKVLELAGTMFNVGLEAPGFLLGNPASAYIESSIGRNKSKIFDNFSNVISNVFDMVKLSIVKDISRNIIRDPFMRKKLFGDKFEEIVKTTYSGKGMNCYQDFDVPVDFIKDLNGDRNNNVGIEFSPDFYLYNKDLSELEKETYIRDTVRTTTNVAKIAANLTLLENRDVYEALEAVDDMIFNDDDDVRKKLFEELNVLPQSGTESNKQEKNLDTNRKDFIRNRIKDLEIIYAQISTNFKLSKDPINPDALKLNLIRSARNKRILELSIMQTAIRMALAGTKFSVQGQEYSTKPFISGTMGKIFGEGGQKEDVIKGTIKEVSLSQLQKMASVIQSFFDVYTGKKKLEEQADLLPFYNTRLSKPHVRLFEEQVYTLVTQLIMLGEALAEANSGNIDFVNLLTDIPEIAMLDWFNWRTIEDVGGKRLELINQFSEEYSNNVRGSNSKMFPTFKIFFVEEDTRTVFDMDDYYSYNAIQSIEVLGNKYSASKTAVIKLSNVFGNLTNKISLMRESQDLVSKFLTENDNLFLGTLDIKPGTKIVIKMGYAANDKYLHTVFLGRVLEMNPGPETEIICQSYGAQLNHYITKMHFGVMSTAKEHGDIASAVLDSIPSLEGFGKPSPFGLNSDRFEGKNFKSYGNKIFEKFLLSNVTSRVNTGLFTADNPRDENIFLPVNLINSILHHVTFDWVVYDQSAWQSLHEISLYHRNTFPITRLYNTDIYGTLDNMRETIVIGDKAGYYKYTDAYSFSTMRVKDIQESVKQWNASIVGVIRELAELSTDVDFLDVASGNTSEIGASAFLRQMVAGGYVVKRARKGGGVLDAQVDEFYATTKLLPVMKFFRNKQNAMMLVKKILDSTNYNAPTTISGFTWDLISSKFPGLIDTAQGTLIRTILAVGYQGDFNEDHIDREPVGTITYSVGFGANANASFGPLFKVIDAFRQEDNLALIQPNGAMYNIHPADLLHVDAFEPDNTAEKYRNNPRYKRIQKQHLITDTSDIINNNIVLSEDFKNAVSVYYLPEPKFYSSLGTIDSEDFQNLKAFTVKAFGDIRDGDVRLLETYQKNVDTNWLDTRLKTEQVFRGYQRDYDKNFSKDEKTDWSKFPSFVVVAINLLQRETEKMYRGSLTIVGNPTIEPMDIIHIDDLVHGMSGPIEVEEVIHSISPDGGFHTTITPALITYDRDPITTSDLSTMNRIMNVAESKRSSVRWGAVARASAFGAFTTFGVLGTITHGNPLGFVIAVAGVIPTFTGIWDATVGAEQRYNKFLYDSMANVFGRDCINFTTLFYHQKPYMCGFDGVDYTNLKTLINHQWQGQGVIQRLATVNDVEYNWIVTQGNLQKIGPIASIVKNELVGGEFVHYVYKLFSDESFGQMGTDHGIDIPQP